MTYYVRVIPRKIHYVHINARITQNDSFTSVYQFSNNCLVLNDKFEMLGLLFDLIIISIC